MTWLFNLDGPSGPVNERTINRSINYRSGTNLPFADYNVGADFAAHLGFFQGLVLGCPASTRRRGVLEMTIAAAGHLRS